MASLLLPSFINDLGLGVSNETATFANDTKLFWMAETQAEGKELQTICPKWVNPQIV